MATRGRSSYSKYTHENEVFEIGNISIKAKPINEISKHFGYIYVTKCLAENKYYLGLRYKTSGTLSYLGSGRYLKSAIKKYGKSNFYKIIIDFADSLEDLETKEQFYIQHYFGYNLAKSKLWYNIFDGKQRGGNSWAGYTHDDYIRRQKLTSEHNKNRVISDQFKIEHSKFMNRYYQNPMNRKKASKTTRQGMATKKVAQKLNHYIQYPIYIKGKAYYNASQIARDYNLSQGYVYDRLRRGLSMKEVIKPPKPNTDKLRWGHFQSYTNRIKDCKTYAKLYRVYIGHTQYLFLSSSYIRLAKLITSKTECSIGKNYTRLMVKKEKFNFHGIITIDQIEEIPDKYQTLYACGLINSQIQNKDWNGILL